MSVIKKMRKQVAVWWRRSSSANAYGEFDFAAPEEIACRWDDMGQEFRNGQGQTEMSTSTVYVDREMSPGDMLALIELDSDTPESPKDFPLAHEIKKFAKTPNFKATEFLYTAFL